MGERDAPPRHGCGRTEGAGVSDELSADRADDWIPEDIEALETCRLRETAGLTNVIACR